MARAKIWLANQQSRTYGGSYTWDGIAAGQPAQTHEVTRSGY
jgi:hypothetical protein